MASNIIGEGILVIASVIIAGTVAGIVLTKVGVFESSITSTTQAQQDKLLTKIKIIYASNSSNTNAEVWIKNIGKNPITSLDKIDVYFGEIGAVQRYAYEIGNNDNTWEYAGGLTNLWQVMDTIQVNIDDDDLTTGITYMLRITTPNGVSDDYIFSLS